MPEASAAAELIDRLSARRPDLVGLARLASVASVIEPPLLRRLRTEVGPLTPDNRLRGSAPWDAGLESDLWFSSLAHVATAGQLTLRPDVLEVLRSQLASPGHAAEAKAARRVVEHAHEEHPDAIRLEERIIWSALQGDADDIGAALARALAALSLGPEHATAVVRWFLQARRRLPAAALEHEQGQQLAAAVALHVDRVIPPELLAANRFPEALAGLMPSSLPFTSIGVQLADGGLRFVPVTDAGAGMIDLPDTRPLVVEVTWETEAGETQVALVTAEEGSAAPLDGLGETAVLRTVAGTRIRIEARKSRQVVVALFGNAPLWSDFTDSQVSARLTRLLRDPDATVHVVRNPSDLTSKPEVLLIGSIPKAVVRPALVSLAPKFAVAARRTRSGDGEPAAAMIAMPNASQDIIALVVDRAASTAGLPVTRATPKTQEALIIAMVTKILAHPLRMYTLDVQSARTMLQSLTVAFHLGVFSRDEASAEQLQDALRDLPADEPEGYAEGLTIFDHVQRQSEHFFAGPVADYLAGAAHPIQPPWGSDVERSSFDTYVHWFVDRLHRYTELLGTHLPPRVVPVGYKVPTDVLDAVRVVVGTETLPPRFDEPVDSSDDTLYAVQRADLAGLIKVLAEPVLQAVDNEARYRASSRYGEPDLRANIGDGAPDAVLDHRRLSSLADWLAAGSWPPRSEGMKTPRTTAPEEEIRGLARRVADVINPDLWSRVRSTAQQITPRPLLLQLAVSHLDIPWELAELDQPLDPSLPPFLGCQVAVAIAPDVPRWQQQPPTLELSGEQFAVMMPSASGLRGAEQEAEELIHRYGAQRLPDELDGLLSHLQAPDIRVLHLAGNGASGPSGGLLLANGELLTPNLVSNLILDSAPFVFLNADASTDLAAAFLKAGARAVVAPVWALSDTEASEFARGFYHETLTVGLPPTEVLRRLRCLYTQPDFGPTALSYRYYGHQNLTITWTP